MLLNVLTIKPEKYNKIIDKYSDDILNVELFSGVIGYSIDIKSSNLFDYEKFIYRYGREPLHGEVGCVLSHLNLFKKIANQNLPFQIVIEDDAILTEELKKIISTDDFKSLMTQENTIVSFYTRNGIVDLKSKIKISNATFYRVKNRSYGTVCYAISKSLAQNISSSITKVSKLADWFFDIDKVNFYVASDQLVFHDDDISQINSHKVQKSILRNYFFKTYECLKVFNFTGVLLLFKGFFSEHLFPIFLLKISRYGVIKHK